MLWEAPALLKMKSFISGSGTNVSARTRYASQPSQSHERFSIPENMQIIIWLWYGLYQDSLTRNSNKYSPLHHIYVYINKHSLVIISIASMNLCLIALPQHSDVCFSELRIKYSFGTAKFNFIILHPPLSILEFSSKLYSIKEYKILIFKLCYSD